MANQWFRMYSEFATDPKVQMLPEAMQRRLVMLFCMRCGDVTVTLRDDEIAFHLRISDTELEETKALFVAKGFIDSGWNITNWEKRQFASDSSAARTKAYRDRKKNVPVTSHVTKGDALDTDTDTDTEQKKELGAPAPKAERSPTGSRLPADWKPDAELTLWAARNFPSVNAGMEADKFRDFWHGKAGKDGRKSDWPATWRNWIRRAAERTGAPMQAQAAGGGRRAL